MIGYEVLEGVREARVDESGVRGARGAGCLRGQGRGEMGVRGVRCEGA